MRKLLYILIISIIFIFIFYKIISSTFDTSLHCNKLNKLKNNTTYDPKKILIITLETRPSEMLNIHNYNIDNYSTKHGYQYLFLNNYENDLKLPIYWKKIQLIRDLLHKTDYEYIMWMDSDTLILDQDLTLQSILNLGYSSTIYIGRDVGSSDLNAGVFIIKNDIHGKTFIDELINTYLKKDKCKDKNGEYSLNSGWAGECYEQGIMNELLKTKYKKNTTVLEPYIIWNLHTPVSNIFILHLWAGLNKGNHREDAFKNLLKNNKSYDSRLEQFLYLIHKITGI